MVLKSDFQNWSKIDSQNLQMNVVKMFRAGLWNFLIVWNGMGIEGCKLSSSWSSWGAVIDKNRTKYCDILTIILNDMLLFLCWYYNCKICGGLIIQCSRWLPWYSGIFQNYTYILVGPRCGGVIIQCFWCTSTWCFGTS